MQPACDVVIVGAGLAGLVCAQDLSAAGVQCLLIEAADGVGGRVRTDVLDGYQLDRGFQILLTAYPQVRRRLDLDALALGRFDPGALVRRGGRFHTFSDPLRRPGELVRTLASPVATFVDMLRVARLLIDVRGHSVPSLLRRPDATTAARLSGLGFSTGFIEAFWRPLFAGIGLDPQLEVSSRRFDTIVRMLAAGATALPASGIGAVPQQIAATLPAGAIRLDARVSALAGTGVVLADGERVSGTALVVATDGPSAHALLGAVPDPGSRPAACCWFAAAGPPLRGPRLILDGDASGPARNVVVMTEVAPSYAPPGRTLIAAAVPGPPALEPSLASRVREQLAGWFGSMSGDWELLRTDVIRHGQPAQGPPLHPRQRVTFGDGIFVCGDHRDTASIQGAMFSGERTAAAVLRHLRG